MPVRARGQRRLQDVDVGVVGGGVYWSGWLAGGRCEADTQGHSGLRFRFCQGEQVQAPAGIRARRAEFVQHDMRMIEQAGVQVMQFHGTPGPLAAEHLDVGLDRARTADAPLLMAMNAGLPVEDGAGGNGRGVERSGLAPITLEQLAALFGQRIQLRFALLGSEHWQAIIRVWLIGGPTRLRHEHEGPCAGQQWRDACRPRQKSPECRTIPRRQREHGSLLSTSQAM